MMMMKVSPKQQTRPTCVAVAAALLSLLLVVLSFGTVTCTSTIKIKNGMATPEEYKKQQQRMLMKTDSIDSDDKNIFTQTFISVTQAPDFVTRLPNGGSSASFTDDIIAVVTAAIGASMEPDLSKFIFPLQGSSITQKGAVFGPDSVEIANAPEGVLVEQRLAGGCGDMGVQYSFAGDRKVKFMPQEDPFYFFHGQCVVTSGILEPEASFKDRFSSMQTFMAVQPVITSHSCRLNLCLGGGGFNCIAIYSGTAFVFNIGKGFLNNNEGTGGGIVAGGGAGVGAGPRLSFESPPLPPPFPGTILGGTGSFEGIEGSVNIATIAGTTGPILGPTFLSPLVDPVGSIVQVISVKSNMPLPPGP